MRSEWLGLIAVALLGGACAASKADPLLPMNDTARAFIAANCAVPVTTEKRTVGEGDAARVLTHIGCRDERRDFHGVKLWMTITFDAASQQVVELYVAADAFDAVEIDSSFERLYTGLIEPFLVPARRDAARTFALAPAPAYATFDDPDVPNVRYRRSLHGPELPSRSLTITRRPDAAP